MNPLNRAGAVLLLLMPSFAQGETIHEVRMKMGTRFEITVVASDRAAGQVAIDAAYAEIDRVEALISEWKPESPVSEINRNAGIAPVRVPPELFRFIRRSLKVSELTGGAFDITW